MYLSRKRLSFGALIADLYCLSIIVGPFEALYVVFAKRPVGLWFQLALGLVMIVITIAYHAKLSRVAPFFTPGEIILGRCWRHGEKWWANPYQTSRALMFGLVFVTLMFWGNSWDSVADERFYSTLTLPTVVGRTVLSWAGLGGLLSMGLGRPQGAYVVAALFALSTLAALSGFASTVPAPLVRITAIASAIMVVYGISVGVFYSRRVEV